MRITPYFIKSLCAVVTAVGEGLVPAPIQDFPELYSTPPPVVQIAPRPTYAGDTLTESYDEWRKEFARYTTIVDTSSAQRMNGNMTAALRPPLPVLTLTLDRA